MGISRCAILYLFPTLLLCSLGWTACQPQLVVQIPKYRPLTSAEVQKVAREKNFTAVAIEQRTHLSTILFDCNNGRDYGFYNGAIDQDGTQSYSQSQGSPSCFGSGYPDRSGVVSFIGGELLSNGDYSSGVIIHDQTIARKVQSVKLLFSNGRQVIVPTNRQRGVFVQMPDARTMTLQEIILYTADGKEVYHSR